jgi:hypothetical protein
MSRSFYVCSSSCQLMEMSMLNDSILDIIDLNRFELI